MKKLILMTVVSLMLLSAPAFATGTKWNHENNIQEAVKLVMEGAIPKGGMSEAITLSKDCYDNYNGSGEPQLLEMCAAIDITAMIYDYEAAQANGWPRNEYFADKTMKTRISSHLKKKKKMPKKEIENAFNIWGNMTRAEYEKYNKSK